MQRRLCSVMSTPVQRGRVSILRLSRMQVRKYMTRESRLPSGGRGAGLSSARRETLICASFSRLGNAQEIKAAARADVIAERLKRFSI
jgi:hypothetical protein